MRIIYRRTEWLKCRQWVKWAGLDSDGKGSVTEVMWMGRAVVDGTQDIWIEEVRFLPMQNKATGGECSISGDELADFYALIMEEGGRPEEWNCWGHSHGNAGVFQSGQDVSNTKERFQNKHWAVAVTHNVKDECYGEVTIFKPFYARIEKVPVLIETAELTAVELEALSEVQAWNDRVRKEVVAGNSATSYFHGWEGWGGGRAGKRYEPQGEEGTGEKGAGWGEENGDTATDLVAAWTEKEVEVTLKEYDGEDIEVATTDDYVEYQMRDGELWWNSLTFNGPLRKVTELGRKKHALGLFIERELKSKQQGMQYREFQIGGDFHGE